MAEIHVTDREGAEHTLAATPGWSVMEIIREAGLPIEAACGGCCACATCHAKFALRSIARRIDALDDEIAMLDEAFEVETNSRLSCQIAMTPELNGLEVTIAPDWT